MKKLLDIQIVMVNTTLPANIGSAARAMHTMGLSNLTVINPKLAIDETSYSHAAGGAEILRQAKIVNSLEDAIANSQLIFAASSRSRTMPRPVVNPNQAAHIMYDFFVANELKQTKASKISILFGREDRGLTNDELAVADYHIQIDANPNYPVLNVASAVQVIASFVYSHFVAQKKSQTKADVNASVLQHMIRQEWDAQPINQQQQQVLQQRMVELMTSLKLADDDDLRLLPQRLSRLSSRLQLDEKEYQILQSIISKLLNK